MMPRRLKRGRIKSLVLKKGYYGDMKILKKDGRIENVSFVSTRKPRAKQEGREIVYKTRRLDVPVLVMTRTVSRKKLKKEVL